MRRAAAALDRVMVERGDEEGRRRLVEEEALRQSGLSPHVVAHLITMAALHRQNRYDRLTHDVEKLTGSPPMSIADFVRMHAAEFAPQGS